MNVLKYPLWISENKSKLSQDEVKRYTQQQDIVVEIVNIYKKTDKEPAEEDGQRIVELMQLVRFLFALDGFKTSMWLIIPLLQN